ncbi:MAG: glycosyltransferase family 4 protein [Candidatus Symbiodolus clandestinus]
MKIALLGTTANAVIGFRADLIKILYQQGHQVYAFALDYQIETHDQVTALGAVPVNYSLSRTGTNPFKDIKDTLALSHQLKRLKPDLVLCYFVKPCIFGTLAATLAGIKKRYAMLEGLGFSFTESLGKRKLKITLLKFIQLLLYRLIFPKLDALILLNPDDYQDLIVKAKIPVKRVHLLGGIGLNLKKYPYTAPSIKPITFLFIGRLLAEKGVYEYLDAANTVKQNYPDVRFCLLGALDSQNPGGLTANQLSQLLKKHNIIYPGHVDDVTPWIARSSVFVLPSYREGVPRSTQEAMAMGRAVLTTDVPGCRETVIQGVNGYLVPPRSPIALAEKMVELIENPQLIVEMGLASYRIAQEKFDVHRVNQRLLTMLGIPSSSLHAQDNEAVNEQIRVDDG